MYNTANEACFHQPVNALTNNDLFWYIYLYFS